MDDQDAITIGYGDEITLEHDPFIGDAVVRIMNGAFMEPARWLRVDMAPGHDRIAKINQLIYVLQQLRDSE